MTLEKTKRQKPSSDIVLGVVKNEHTRDDTEESSTTEVKSKKAKKFADAIARTEERSPQKTKIMKKEKGEAIVHISPKSKKEKKKKLSHTDDGSSLKTNDKKDKKNRVVSEEVYTPGALSALFGSASSSANDESDEPAKKKSKKSSSSGLFDKYAQRESGFVDVPAVITEAKAANNDDEGKKQNRNKQRVNRKKNDDDPMSVEERKRTIFVGNLPPDFDQKKLTKMFKGCGKIESTRIRGTVGEKETISKKIAYRTGHINANIHSIIGYVKFADAASVDEALKLNGMEMNEHHVRVDRCVKAKKYDAKVSVFVGNLPFEVTDEELIEWAQENIGPVAFVRVMRDGNTGYGRGSGFISFENAESVTKALTLKDPVLGQNYLRISKMMKKNKLKNLSKGETLGKLKQKKNAGKRFKAHGKFGKSHSEGVENPLLAKRSKKVHKEIVKRKKAKGPKTLMK